jgi:hypothetical protein
MAIPWLGHAIEVSAIAIFAWCWAEGGQRVRGLRAELVVAVVYGVVLELLDMRIFRSYHYGPGTWWWIAEVPLYIPLLWAAIAHSSMALSDRSGLPEPVRPFLDGLLAVLIDLAIDAIAIRVGLWHWGIPLDDGWFGVPAGNLYAWMWVAFWYGWTTRLLRRRLAKGEPAWHRIFVPVIAYTGLLSTLILAGATGMALRLRTHDARLWLFAAHVAAFTLIVANAPRRPGAVRIPRSLFASRWIMHGSFAVLLIASGLWRQAPVLLAVSAASLALEAWAHQWCKNN